jgi:hypothetical protein
MATAVAKISSGGSRVLDIGFYVFEGGSGRKTAAAASLWRRRLRSAATAASL